jgi:hypothetical protein
VDALGLSNNWRPAAGGCGLTDFGPASGVSMPHQRCLLAMSVGGLDSTWSYIISQRSTFTAMSFIRICWAALGLPIWRSRSFLMEFAYLPAFVRPSRSENDSRLLNAPMRRFLRLAIEGRRWRAERCSAITAR